MTTETIDHTTLSKLADAGVVRSAHVIGQEGGWGILVKYGMTERALAAQRTHQVRIFRKLETLVAYLKGVGSPRFDVDAVNYDVGSAGPRKRHADAAAHIGRSADHHQRCAPGANIHAAHGETVRVRMPLHG